MPVRQLQMEVVMRLREDIIPRAGIYYISALQGGDLDGGEDWLDDEEEWMEGPDPEPPRGGRAQRISR